MLKLFFAIGLFVAAVLAAPRNDVDPYIVGGTEASEGSYSFAVTLRDYGEPEFFFCGGAFISNRHILTAAHCVYGIKKFRIGYGSINLTKQIVEDIEWVKIHPSFSITPIYNDIAVVKLKKSVSLEDEAIINFNCTENLDGKTVTAMGWGRTGAAKPLSKQLLYLKKPILSQKDCGKNLNTTLHQGQICLGSTRDHGMCFGDSGSPLFYPGIDGKNYTVGIVSWGIPCAKGYPDVFTSVSYYKNFIAENLN